MKTKREIATLYFPNINPKSASEKLTSWINNCKPLVRKLTTWIKNCKPLTKQLAKTGYRSSTHTLTERQISMIYDYLGEP